MIPIFKTHGSFARSILNPWNEKEVGEKDWPISKQGPVSLIGIAKKYDLKKVVVIDDSFLCFPNLYSNINKFSELIFGINFTCCKNAKDQSEASLKTEHKISILMKNGNGYKDLLKIHNLIHTSKDYFYYKPRIDFNIIQEFWTDNLLLVIPPYDNFIHQNLFYDSICVPDFGTIKPVMTFARMNLPFNPILETNIKNYAQNNNLQIEEVHPVYYYNKNDVKSYMVYRCIENRTEFSAPELQYFCSNDFCWESYCEKNNIKFE